MSVWLREPGNIAQGLGRSPWRGRGAKLVDVENLSSEPH